MKLRTILGVAAVALSFGAAAYGHHSFAAVYNTKKEIKLQGKIVQLLYRNPHSYLHLEAPDENGVVQRWSVEWGAAGSLGEHGVQRDTIKTGDVVTVTGNPSRTPGEYRMRLITLRRVSDGLTWGNRPGETVD